MTITLPRRWRDSLDVVFPRSCVHCAGLVDDGELRHLCSRCTQQLFIVSAPHCTTCGQVNVISGAIGAGSCARQPASYWCGLKCLNSGRTTLTCPRQISYGYGRLLSCSESPCRCRASRRTVAVTFTAAGAWPQPRWRDRGDRRHGKHFMICAQRVDQLEADALLHCFARKGILRHQGKVSR